MPKHHRAARRPAVGVGLSHEDFLKEIEALQRVKVESIACGARHCLAVSERNNVFVWGDNGDGQV